MKFSLALLAGVLALSTSTFPSFSQDSETNVMFIFDSSGSMKKKIESGESRSEAAKRAMVTALEAMPETAKLGLFMYGHRRAKDCSDFEMLTMPGAGTGKAIAKAVMDSQPKGETPIADALNAVAFYFSALPTQSNSIVLVTDGIEECGGDPCAEAKKIRESGTGLKAHVVGFTLDEKQRQAIQCVADETGGKYFDAQDANGLAGALAEVQKVVAEAPPPPAEPVRERVFFDDFDGADLAETWTVNNPNPDGYIVENGNLLMVNGALGGFSTTDGANLIQLETDLPADDWDVKLVFDGEFKSLKDLLEIGLRTDEKNYLSAAVVSSTYNTGSSSSGDNRATMALILRKMSNGTETLADASVQQKNRDTSNPVGFTFKGTLTLSKRGRAYSASLVQEGEKDADGNQVVHKTDSLTSLRSPGKLMLTAAKHAQAEGEFQVNIGSVEIETVKAP